MRPNSYSGKRVYNGRSSSGVGGSSQGLQTLCRVLYFPALFLYLELVLHVSMKTKLSYLPIYLVFSVAAGLFFSALTLPFRRRVNSLLTKVLTVLFSLVYVVEMIAKSILQTYYPLSSLGTAAENHLTDYMEVIVGQVVKSIPVIILFFLPTVLLLFFGSRALGFDRFDIRFAGVILAAAALVHVVGLGVVHLPWSGDVTPSYLYKVDTNIDDQVEQLGLWTMLRLDVKTTRISPGWPTISTALPPPTRMSTPGCSRGTT